MKLNALLRFSILMALLVSGFSAASPAKAAPSSDIIDRTLTYWDATYTGYVDSNRFEKWQFVFGQTYTFTITAIPSSGDLIPVVRVLDQNSNEITAQNGAVTSTQPAGTYYVQIEPFSGSGTYNLTIRQTNSSTATPTPIVPTATSTSVAPTFTSTPSPATATPTSIVTSTAGPSLTPTFTPAPATATPTSVVTSTAGPTFTPTATIPVTATVTPVTPFVSVVASPVSINVNGTSTGSVILNNTPASGYTSAEFTCTYDPTIIQISNFVAGSVFGPSPVMVVNGPAGGTFIVAIAGSNGNKATTPGTAFTFDILGLQAGSANIQCVVRVSDGSDTLFSIPSTTANLTVTTPQGNLNGQVLASKPVTVSLYNPDTTLNTSAVVNPDGTFNLTALGGNYTVVASAAGYLSAQGSPTIVGGSTTTMQTVILLAGDIDGNNTIDQFDAMSIGMNYNLAAPAAADLNNDGTINILDLELLAGNYGQSGALAWAVQ
ncbi:MAG: hypothetical protein IT311_06330 [Anaerolineales bacterium]|nr:hypothetical protein [Anaerolineales bacterium]